MLLLDPTEVQWWIWLRLWKTSGETGYPVVHGEGTPRYGLGTQGIMTKWQSIAVFAGCQSGRHTLAFWPRGRLCLRQRQEAQQYFSNRKREPKFILSSDRNVFVNNFLANLGYFETLMPSSEGTGPGWIGHWCSDCDYLDPGQSPLKCMTRPWFKWR